MTETLMGSLARRVRMTEGQLYTAIIAVAFALLLSLTGLPGAHQRPEDDLLSGGGVPVLSVTTTTTEEAP